MFTAKDNHSLCTDSSVSVPLSTPWTTKHSLVDVCFYVIAVTSPTPIGSQTAVLRSMYATVSQTEMYFNLEYDRNTSVRRTCIYCSTASNNNHIW